MDNLSLASLIRRGRGIFVTETLKKLDHVLDEAREVAFAEPNARAVVVKLLEGAKKLIELAESVSEMVPDNLGIAFPLQASSDPEDMILRQKRRFQEEHVNPAIQQQLAGALYQIRRTRDRVFADADLFGDPAWDILLDLIYAERDRKSVSVTSACMASAVPPTTALRWVAILESRGYIERVQDKLDGRRRYVMLTEKGRSLMNRFFAQLVQRKLI